MSKALVFNKAFYAKIYEENYLENVVFKMPINGNFRIHEKIKANNRFHLDANDKLR